ncbi:MAG: hypothetical protein IJE08_03070 [Clostridia bacterium]|nr:hypothetical protein [Clostridia bacterium]
MKSYYIASCLFTARYPEVSMAIQGYIERRKDIEIVRCCIPNFRAKSSEDKIMKTGARSSWLDLPFCAEYQPGDTAYSLCHNCTNIVDEQNEGVHALSLWELVDADESFVFPDYSGLKVFVQDCWRTRERAGEQAAVRSILKKMNIEFTEAREHHENTDFCGSTLYREQRIQNAQYAPKHYVEQAAGKFLPHTEEEQLALMKDYCVQFDHPVVCYCHYCLEGLLQGGADGRHIAHMLKEGFEQSRR